MSMKTILIPTEHHDAMEAVLETALLLARRCDSYMEGFALRWGINEFVAADVAQHDVAGRACASFGLCHGWDDAALLHSEYPESFEGSLATGSTNA